jgi:hypothetical protein
MGAVRGIKLKFEGRKLEERFCRKLKLILKMDVSVRALVPKSCGERVLWTTARKWHSGWLGRAVDSPSRKNQQRRSAGDRERYITHE